MKRRKFVQKVLVGGFVILEGKAIAKNFYTTDDQVKFRFYVASDGHYGQPKTTFREYHDVIIKKMNKYHSSFPAEFVVLNGDVIHNEKEFLPSAYAAYENLEMDYYVSRGNHDMVSKEFWSEIWGYLPNYDFSIQDYAFLIGDTSNEKGDYLCPDVNWFSAKLDEYKDAKNIFIFLHITPNDWTKYGVKCPDFLDLIDQRDNVTAVFNGHDHQEDEIKFHNQTPFLFDGHFGGSWGTDYRGFRVVELLKDDTLRTYLMDPVKKIKSQII